MEKPSLQQGHPAVGQPPSSHTCIFPMTSQHHLWVRETPNMGFFLPPRGSGRVFCTQVASSFRRGRWAVAESGCV